MIFDISLYLFPYVKYSHKIPGILNLELVHVIL